MTTSVKNNVMPPNFVSNLQQALMGRKGGENDETTSSSNNDGSNFSGDCEEDCSKPRILVTNGDGIESLGLVYLVEALVKEGLYNVYEPWRHYGNVADFLMLVFGTPVGFGGIRVVLLILWCRVWDKSVAGHSVTFGETVVVASAEMNGATAYEVSGTPVDCVSLGLSGALFSWSKPTLVVSGINKGSSCGHHMKKDESSESDITDAVALSVPIINSAVRDVENGSFPKQCALNIQIPTSPSANKGFKVTKQSSWKSTLCWQAVSAKRHPTGYMPNQPGFGIQLAQLGRDASAAGAARRVTNQKKNLEIESVGVAGKSNTDRGVKKYFRLEFLDKEHEEVDDDSDIKALENNFVSVTPFFLSPYVESEVQTSATDWITSTLNKDDK
ncbi:hypothetical protein KSS87_007520 [Heliosperma pusillum]|nr:hypothetical protein KSS87_007520 [Heliosperma pusillum]